MPRKLFLIIIFLLFSCSKNIMPETDKNIYTRGFDTNNIKFSNVFINNSKIYIESINKNKYSYFVGDISNIKLKNKIDDRIFSNRIIKLKKYKQNKKDKENFKEFKDFSKSETINIINYEKWSEIVLPIFGKIIKNVVPNKKNEAILLSIANKNLAIFYNEKDMISMKEVEDLKKNIKIIKIYTEKQFYDFAAEEIKNNPEINNKLKNNLILFEVKNNTKTNSPYVLFDSSNNKQYYFDFSALFKAKEGASNIDYYLQILFNTVFKAHIIEPIKNPITSIQKASTLTYQTIKKTIETKKIKHLKQIPPLNNNNMMDINEFEKKLDKIAGKEKFKGSMEYLIGGAAFFDDFLNEVELSKNEIFIRLYIFSNDDYGVRISNILKNKNDNGINIKILTGGLANNVESMKKSEIPFDIHFKQPKSIGQYLTFNSSINFRTSADTFFVFDHSKMIIIDKEVAYVGGMNIGQPYRYTWHDMMIKLHGPIVHEVHNQFTEAWASAGPFGDAGKFSRMLYNLNPQLKKLQKYYKKNEKNQIDIRILYTKPQNKTIYKTQMEAIKNAKKLIYIENPYLADFKIINALIEARGRGVDVRIILPTKNNVGMMGSSNLVATNIFLKNGIKVYNYQGMTHIKAAIYDGWATLGSANFDNLSLKMNDEFNIAFSDPYYVDKLKKELFDVDFKFSIEVKKPYLINWYDKVMSTFANRF